MATVRWTNPSVRALAQGRDPLIRIREIARHAVVQASDAGWKGPPFDPVALAEIRGIEVVPRDDVRDARIVPTKRGLRIEYNPLRPRGRSRFSIAHEVAHTLFADCAEEIRHRGEHPTSGRSDRWQLEMLCNLAAAEFLLPYVDFPSLSEDDLNVGALLRLRERYDVSMEALCLRIARVVAFPCAAICASPVVGGTNQGHWRLDYLAPSTTWPDGPKRGLILGTETVLNEAMAVGVRVSQLERWGDVAVQIEGITLPPYRGFAVPRVVGMVRPSTAAPTQAAGIKFVLGDATHPVGTGARLIAHVVNDRARNWGPRGFAAALTKRWPAARREYRDWVSQDARRLRLGSVHVANVSEDKRIISMIAQRGYGEQRKLRLQYDALERCLALVAETASASGASVHIPRIGSGQAGGEWTIVEYLIRETLVANGVDVTVYTLPGASESPAVEQQLNLGLS